MCYMRPQHNQYSTSLSDAIYPETLEQTKCFRSQPVGWKPNEIGLYVDTNIDYTNVQIDAYLRKYNE